MLFRSTTTTTTTTTKRNVMNNVTFILPDDTQKVQAHHISVVPSSHQQQHRSTTTVTYPHMHIKNHSSVWTCIDDESEIELPAGRLYQEQQQLYDDDDDDNESQLSLEGATTFREDFVNMFMKGHHEEIQEKEKYMQYCTEQLERNCNITDDGMCI